MPITKFAPWEDEIHPAPGNVEYAVCGVCGLKMSVERNTYVPAGFRGHLPADVFTCIDKDLDWHKQLKLLWREHKATASAKIAKILEEEIEEVFINRKATR